MNVAIVIDSCTDLPYSFIKEKNVPVVNFSYFFKGKEFIDDFGQTIDYKSFYDDVRSGEMPTTSQVNTDAYIQVFKPLIEENKSIIFLSFSSGLSGSFANANIAKNMLLEKYPDASITLIDTKAASLGGGLIAYYAIEMMEKGASKEEIVNWVEENKLKVHHWFTVEDLNHLKRGGRVSGTAAFIGTLLSIKPILNVNKEGKLIPVLKVKGRKKSIKTLCDKIVENIVNPEDQVIFISHGDCLEDANYLAKLIKEELKVKDILINNVGPVIGAHSGPGTVALFFIGNKRN